MEKPNVGRKILNEIENLVAGSTKSKSRKCQKLHIAILKNHYNAAAVSIDYHRKRVKMDIVVDDNSYDPKKVNTNIQTLYANLLFNNLGEFLISCIDKDSKSLAIYASLIKSFKKKEVKYVIA